MKPFLVIAYVDPEESTQIVPFPRMLNVPYYWKYINLGDIQQIVPYPGVLKSLLSTHENVLRSLNTKSEWYLANGPSPCTPSRPLFDSTVLILEI